MPELPETMYCSEQICIPPTFPYLLRQYAKAAIRTQPIDLLRWSTAYFRCLSLNLRPPVKPRLEYPIPKSHHGLTPGWLKALLHQLENNRTVLFKVLWDRWIGACLEHKNLIEILCLAGFTEPNAIPWYRFIAISAAHLTENLTQTMILVCEILTEEPEGGCAMITLETFVDVYKFLAAIDASKPQILINLYFTDSLLSLYREPIVEKVKESVTVVEEEVEEESVAVEEEEILEVETGPVDDQIGLVISCPDISPDDYKTEDYFLMEAEENDGKLAEEEQSKVTIDMEIDFKNVINEVEEVNNEQLENKNKEDDDEQTQQEDAQESEELKEELEDVEGEPVVHTVLTLSDSQSKVPGEDEELCSCDEELKSCSCEEGSGYTDELKHLLQQPESEEEAKEEPEPTGQEVYVDAIPGIGATVSVDLVEAVVKYMEECAKRQHGMVMPRNIRHFNCPPLERLEY